MFESKGGVILYFEFKGKSYNYSIEDDKITIFKKKNIVFTGNISDIVLLCFVEKNFLGVGQIVLSLPDTAKVFIDGFKEKQRDDYIKLFQILKDKAEYLDLSYIKAASYIKPEVREERELKKAAKREPRDMKMKLLKEGYKQIAETKCVCTQCSNVWFFGSTDKIDDISNRLIAVGAHMQGKSLTGSYHEQLIKDADKCPQCGSRAITKQKVKYWFNSKTGDRIEVNE
jgi:DNA-directed RNA polymerase subunit RPC12/RpoP